MRQDVYKVALDEANSELVEISNRYDELRRRKESLETVVAALGPVLGMQTATQAQHSVSEQVSAAPQGNTEPASYSFDEASSSHSDHDDSVADPFQQRVRNALKFSSNNNGHEHKGLQPAV